MLDLVLTFYFCRTLKCTIRLFINVSSCVYNLSPKNLLCSRGSGKLCSPFHLFQCVKTTSWVSSVTYSLSKSQLFSLQVFLCFLRLALLLISSLVILGLSRCQESLAFLSSSTLSFPPSLPFFWLVL